MNKVGLLRKYKTNLNKIEELFKSGPEGQKEALKKLGFKFKEDE